MVDNSDDDNHDFTSIADRTAFIHSDDLEAELKFKQLNPANNKKDIETLSEVSHQQADDLPPDLPPELSFDSEELPKEDLIPELDNEIIEEQVSEDDPKTEDFLESEELKFNGTAFSEETILEDVDLDFSFEEKPIEELAEEFKEDLPIYKEPETFSEVKNFATNFSYGEVQAGGNPPFSLLIKDIKFQEDADDILTILKEFKILNSSNEHDFLKSLDYGMLLIPQIGEYIAIILTNKFRRFDCEIQMGLSDQINPSDLSEYNPRGLTSKLNLSQNKKEHFIFDKDLVSRNEIMATTTSNFIGYTILQYQGVETSFRIIESADLERLHFIHNTLNQSLEHIDEETLNDYTDFNFNFHKIYTDLLNELKEKAYKNSSNALLGVVYSLTPFLMEQDLKNNKYQITCTATLATIINDDNNKNEVP